MQSRRGTTINGQRRILAVLGCSLWLGACAHVGSGVSGTSPSAANAVWLAGAWVERGTSCAGDAGVIYRANGTWISDGAEGTWQIKHGKLLLDVKRQEDETGVSRTPDRRLRIADEIMRLAPNEFAVRRADGSSQRFVRCGKPRF